MENKKTGFTPVFFITLRDKIKFGFMDYWFSFGSLLKSPQNETLLNYCYFIDQH